MACICPHLISGASEVSLVPRPEDRTRLLGSTLRSFSGPAQLRRFYSVPEYWAGPGNEATLVSQDYLCSCTSSMPCFLFDLDLLSLCSFCCAVSTAWRAVMFDSMFLFHRCLRSPSRVTSSTRLYHIDDPRSFTSRTSVSTTP